MQSATAMSRLVPSRRLLRERAAWAWPRRVDAGLAGLVAALQLGATFAVTSYHDPARSLRAVDVVLVLAGPVALLARRRYPAIVMWIAFLASLGPRTDGFAYLSLIVTDEGTTVTKSAGAYDTEVVLDQGGWRFRSVVLDLDSPF